MHENGLSDRLQLLFLLHDATETWYSDISKPLKPLLTGYGALEDAAHKVVWAAFGIEPPTKEEWEIVMEYDVMMLRIEIAQLMPDPEEFGVSPIYDSYPIKPVNPEETEELFLKYLDSLLLKEGAKVRSVTA
ncbi:hypothetical protein D3C72_1190340 [compost metagenome]